MSQSTAVPSPSSSQARSAKAAPSSEDLQRIQRKRKQVLRLGVVGLLALVAVSQSLASRHSQIHDLIEALGLAAIGVCIFGRGWCSLYIGGRKKTELVTTGPYSMSRNPLYVFSFIGAFGVGAQTGSVVMGLLFSVLCWLVFRSVVLREEAMLAERFGRAFGRYMNTVPRFRPTWFRWRDEETLVCKPRLFLTTTRDAIWFLAAGPVFEGVKLLQENGWLKPVIWLP
ncbi:MAG: methyltransferase family protein [Thalassospira sp.]|uniref:methyltransferase family protein n=1 Tax=Thalassospira sp. TaxID=1912094 RepID=UPI003A84124A